MRTRLVGAVSDRRSWKESEKGRLGIYRVELSAAKTERKGIGLFPPRRVQKQDKRGHNGAVKWREGLRCSGTEVYTRNRWSVGRKGLTGLR